MKLMRRAVLLLATTAVAAGCQTDLPTTSKAPTYPSHDGIGYLGTGGRVGSDTTSIQTAGIGYLGTGGE
jgi:ABC-type glycerol-3-phosphate transport system substrate-binding protein